MKHYRSIKAGEFKAKCLRIMEEVNAQHLSYVITKHGKPIAKLVPMEEQTTDFFGCLKDTATIQGDIIAPIDATWEADE